MALRGAGATTLRWLLWLTVAWILIRGIATFLPGIAESAPKAAPAEPAARAEPAGVHAFPAIFLNEYLTWAPTESDEAYAKRLHPFLSADVAQRIVRPGRPGSGGQRVTATWVHAVAAISQTRWLVTVAVRVSPYAESAQVATPAPLYIAVPIARIAEGGWVVYDYPTLVPPPPAGEFTEPLHYGREVPDEGGQVKTLLTRFFPAYLSGNTTDLAYYLTPEARVRAFRSPWTFDSVTEVILSQTESGLYALAQVVLVDPATGARYTNRYTTGLVKRDGRWYVNEILQKGE